MYYRDYAQIIAKRPYVMLRILLKEIVSINFSYSSKCQK